MAQIELSARQPQAEERPVRPSVTVDRISIDKSLYDFVNDEVIPGTGVKPDEFWRGFAGFIEEMAPRNATLLNRRDELQSKIDQWHRKNAGPGFDARKYRAFLTEIGYLVAEDSVFSVSTANVDAEIAHIAGPQLVVPVSNARYALNAANARWGSLYDALYGTDAIPEDGAPRGGAYNPQRGAKVIAFVREFLDSYFPLAEGSHRQAVGYRSGPANLQVTLESGSVTGLKNPDGFRGFQGARSAPAVILLVHHGLHVELHIDRSHHIGRDDPAGISDVVIESAITTIQDCEDSVAAVDAEDKVHVYRNWLGLMRGDLEAAMRDLAASASSLRDLTRNLQRNPSGTLFGKAQR